MSDVENVGNVEEVKEVKKSRKNGKKETDTKSLRLSSNNIEWLDEFFQEHGNLTQDEAFTVLRKAAEFGDIKAKVPGRADEIDDVRHLCDQLVTKYLSAVEGIAIAREKAEEDVKGQMDKLRSQIETLTMDVAYWKERYDEESKKRNNWIGKAQEYLNLIESQKERISDLRFVNDSQKETITKREAEIVKLQEQLKNVPDMSAMMQETLQQMQDIIKKSSADAEENKENKEGKEGKEGKEEG